ncbi:RNA ligase 2 [Megavirus lba]|uniref:RNA ligase 2 n=1 Tax=Megavirus lba TaxID=1235314 RepID=L7Y3A9_9VIRU|nr:RNA ligase 2 [Megavirus lba]
MKKNNIECTDYIIYIITTMNMEINQFFQKYFSIENLNARSFKSLQKNGLLSNNIEWIALEKIHGANFSFITNGEKLETAKRTGIISSEEYFFNYQIVVERYSQDVFNIFNKIKKNIDNLMSIQIYGELFGGAYPDMYVKDIKPIQKGVYYNPDIDFLIFDIKINYKTESGIPENNYSEFLSHDEVINYISKTNIRIVPEISRAIFTDIIKMDPVFHTKVPAMYGLPQINNNLAEGYVFKMNARHLCNIFRPIIKSKNDDIFGEVHKSSIKYDIKDLLLKNSEIGSSYEEIKCYLTKNRFDGIIGKIGPDNKPAKIIGCFIADALREYEITLDADKKIEYNKNKRNISKNITIYISNNPEIQSWFK